VPGFKRIGKRRPERGCGAPHRRERERWKQLVEEGRCFCSRCFLPIAPGTPWHLDHREDRQGYRGVSHASCNRRAGAKKGVRVANAKRSRRKQAGVLTGWMLTGQARNSRVW
jgi:hypothetical protein